MIGCTDRWLQLEEIAKLFGLSEDSIKRLAKSLLLAHTWCSTKEFRFKRNPYRILKDWIPKPDRSFDLRRSECCAS